MWGRRGVSSARLSLVSHPTLSLWLARGEASSEVTNPGGWAQEDLWWSWCFIAHLVVRDLRVSPAFSPLIGHPPAIPGLWLADGQMHVSSTSWCPVRHPSPHHSAHVREMTQNNPSLGQWKCTAPWTTLAVLCPMFPCLFYKHAPSVTHISLRQREGMQQLRSSWAWKSFNIIQSRKYSLEEIKQFKLSSQLRPVSLQYAVIIQSAAATRPRQRGMASGKLLEYLSFHSCHDHESFHCNILNLLKLSHTARSGCHKC